MTNQEKNEKTEEYLENWKRERAAFLNYKREEAERIKKHVKFSNEKFIKDILIILDNIYLAEKELPEDLKNNQWVEGMLKTKTQILNFLKTQGVEEIDCLNESFNPNFHEAIDIIENKDKSGIIIEEINKGYILHGKVIRPSKVRIAK